MPSLIEFHRGRVIGSGNLLPGTGWTHALCGLDAGKRVTTTASLWYGWRTRDNIALSPKFLASFPRKFISVADAALYLRVINSYASPTSGGILLQTISYFAERRGSSPIGRYAKARVISLSSSVIHGFPRLERCEKVSTGNVQLTRKKINLVL